MTRETMLNNRLQACPSYLDWRQALNDFIKYNNSAPEPRQRLDQINVALGAEFARRAYIAGPLAQLP